MSLYPVMYLPCDCQLLRIERAPGVSEHRSLLRRWSQDWDGEEDTALPVGPAVMGRLQLSCAHRTGSIID